MCVWLVCGSFWWLEEEHRKGYKEWRGDAQEKTKLIFKFKTANEPNHTKKEIPIASKLSGAKKKKKKGNKKELLLKLYIHMVSKK